MKERIIIIKSNAFIHPNIEDKASINIFDFDDNFALYKSARRYSENKDIAYPFYNMDYLFSFNSPNHLKMLNFLNPYREWDRIKLIKIDKLKREDKKEFNVNESLTDEQIEKNNLSNLF